MKYLRDELQSRLEKMGMYNRTVDGATHFGKGAERADILRVGSGRLNTDQEKL